MRDPCKCKCLEAFHELRTLVQADACKGLRWCRPGVVEGVEAPLAVALRVVGSLRSPFAPTNPTYHLLRSEGAPMGPDPPIGRGMAASAPPDKSRSHVSCPCAAVVGSLRSPFHTEMRSPS